MSEEKVSRRKYIKYAGAAIVVVAAAGGGYYYYQTTTEAKRPIKIGFPAPLTGAVAGVAQMMVNGATLAVEEINAGGGILGRPVELITADVGEMEAGQVASAFTKLIERDKVNVIHTGYVSNNGVEFPIVQAHKIPYVFHGIAMVVERMLPQDPSAFTYIWDATVTYEPYRYMLSRKIADWEKEGKFKPIRHKFALIMSNNEYSLMIGNGNKKELTNMGWKQTIEETVAFGKVEDWRTVLAKIRADPPDLIIDTDYLAFNGAQFLLQFLEDPTPSLIFIQSAPSFPEFMQILGDKSNGVLWNYGVPPRPLTPEAKGYIDKFNKRFGMTPNPYGMFCYDGEYIIKAAIERAGDPNNPDKIVEALGKTDYKGVIGRYAFDPKTHLCKSGEDYIPFVTMQVWNQAHVILDPPRFTEGSLRMPPWYEQGLKKYGT